MSPSLLNVVKNILRSAVRVGFEEAGARVCGPTGWAAIKAVVLPIIEELERRYPKLLLVPTDMEKAQQDLAEDDTLKKLLEQQLAAIKEGHEQILAVLFRNEETLTSYRDLFFRAIQEADNRNESRHERVISEIREVKTDIEREIRAISVQKGRVFLAPVATIEGIYEQSNGYQSDAMTWITAGQANFASERLSIARQLALAGFEENKTSPKLMAAMGYIEKSQAQVSMLRNDPAGATENLKLAAEYFARALQIAPKDLGALNGMANVYYFGGDYDSAIELGLLIRSAHPSYGAALSDLGLSLEGKINQGHVKADLLSRAITIDEELLRLMPLQPHVFRASDLAYVEQRLKRYRRLL